jgi:outer membrane protein assembly factor BamB
MWKSLPTAGGLCLALAIGAGSLGRAQPPQDRASAFALILDTSGRALGVLASHERTLARINPRTGSVVWQRALPTASTGGPVIVGETAVIQACSGGYCLYGLDVQTGGLKWTLDDASEQWGSLEGRSVSMTTDGQYFLSTRRFSDRIFSVDPRTAKIKWQAPGRRRIDVMIPIDGQLLTDVGVFDLHTGRKLMSFDPGQITAADGTGGLLVIASGDGFVSRVHPRTLVPIWKSRVDSFDTCQVLATETVVASLGIRGEVLVSMEGHLTVLDPVSGTPLWKLVLQSTRLISNHAVRGDRDHVYITYTADSRIEAGKVVAYAARDGRVDWTYQFPRNAPVDGVVAKDGLVYLQEGPSLTALDSATGQVRWHFNLTSDR